MTKHDKINEYYFVNLGDYHISLTYNGEHIDDSPYHISLRAQSSLQEQVLPPSTIPIRALVEPNQFYVGLLCPSFMYFFILYRLLG